MSGQILSRKTQQLFLQKYENDWDEFNSRFLSSFGTDLCKSFMLQ